MKKIYSLLLTAAALLVGTTAWAATRTVGIAALSPDYTDLGSALNAAADGDVIELISNVTSSADPVVWIGTTSATGNGAKHLTLDLGGFTYTHQGNHSVAIAISRGSLTIRNGKLVAENIKKDGDFIRVYGTYEKIDVLKSTPFTELIVEKSATITSNQNAISLDVIRDGEKSSLGKTTYDLDYSCEFFTSTFGVANGVKVEIEGNLNAYKYGIKSNGTIRLGKEYMNNASYPEYRKKSSNSDVYFLPGTGKNTGSYILTASDSTYSPYIHIASSAVIKTTDHTNKKAVAIYASGYARWLVEGTCEGSTGVWVKSGSVELHDANISSNWEGAFDPIDGNSSSGVTGAGSAVAMESNQHYTGSIAVTISGDSKLSAENGYALEENVTNPAGTTKVDYLTVTGGTFEGGDVRTAEERDSEDPKYIDHEVDGTVSISHTTIVANNNPNEITTISVIGGSVDNTANTDFGGQDLAAFLTTQSTATHLTTVTDEQGNTTMVISQGNPPTPNNSIKGHNADYNLKWNGTSETIGENEDPLVVEIGELEINETEDDDFDTETPEVPVTQTVIIKNGYTLKARRIIMGSAARIIVEAGGKLIVTGDQGIVAPVVDNILLKTSETAQAILLFKPEVSSNRHPNATVELYSKAYRKANGDQVWQRFGVPTYNDDLKRTDINYDHSEAPTAWRKIDHQDWVAFPATEGLKPFVCYGLTTSATSAVGVYEFKCPLMGNDNATLALTDEWNYYANSYMAPININAMFAIMQGAVEGTMYLYNPDNNWWFEINKATYYFHNELPREVNPMQAFVFHRRAEGADPVLNYANHIWNPIMNPASAPARNLNSINKAMVEIAAADGTKDCVRMVEDAQFSADFDNSYDASKYMNENSFNLFAGENLGIIATDNLEGTALTLTTKDQTSFTMTISQVNGMDYAIRDNLTGTEIAMVEGATYMFSVPANSTVEGRFEIVPMAKMPTAIENIEATAAVKGIYTVSGQFMGYNYHILPKGVYVVDGMKIVK